MAKPDWITLSKSSGTGNDTVTVTAAKNTTGAARSGSITVTAGGVTKTVSITQEKIVNSIRGNASQFMDIIVPYDVFTTISLTLTFQAQILLSRSSTVVTCEPLRINADERTQKDSFGVLDLYSSTYDLVDEDYVTGIEVFVYAGNQPDGTPCGQIRWGILNDSPNLTFRCYNGLSGQTSQATLGSNYGRSIALNFLSNQLPVSGETVIEYNGNALERPSVRIVALK